MRANSNYVVFIWLSACLLKPFISYGEETNVKKLQNLSIEQLGNVTVTSVSKQPERAFEASSAIYVITDEDIKRSGAENIPEALRLAPGLQVAQVDSNKWSITSRGFSAVLANKLLVLIDGRSVYTPEYSGVYWDAQDVVLEDVKRIEIIRGSGGALWGANAVNGIINIITKNSKETMGKLFSGTYGHDHIGKTGSVRYGGKVNDKIYYRTYAKYLDKGDVKRVDNIGAGTSWNQYRSGFRLDTDKIENNSYNLQGDIYYSEKDRKTTITSQSSKEVFAQDNNSGFNLLGSWNKKNDNSSETILQFYIDNARRDHILFNRNIYTYDIDFQNAFDVNEKNRLTIGGGFRFIENYINQDSVEYNFPKNKYLQNIYNIFANNKYSIIANKVFFTLGSKFEHNNYTGYEIQPSAKISWLPTEKQTLWASISKAVRTPSVAENYVSLVDSPYPKTGGLVKNIGNQNIKSEKLISYELGHRIRPKTNFFLDNVIFYNNYRDIRSFEKSYLKFPDIMVPVANNGKAETYGAEISLTYDLSDKWRIKSNYSYINMNLNIDKESNKDAGKTPKNQFSIRSSYNLRDNIDVDNVLYYYSQLNSIDVDAYARFDTRIAWRPNEVKGLEVSLTGQNLFNGQHQEFSKPAFTPSSPPEIGRVVYLKFTWEFN